MLVRKLSCHRHHTHTHIQGRKREQCHEEMVTKTDIFF
jgi:hypothetical protein